MKWAAILAGTAVALFLAVGFGRLQEARWSSGNSINGPRCSAETELAGGDGAIDFTVHCDGFWPDELTFSARPDIRDFSSELSTEKDVLIFGGGGPSCERTGRGRFVCEGDIDEGESFSGRVVVSGDQCDAAVRLEIFGGEYSDHAKEGLDIGQTAIVNFPMPAGCSA